VQDAHLAWAKHYACWLNICSDAETQHSTAAVQTVCRIAKLNAGGRITAEQYATQYLTDHSATGQINQTPPSYTYVNMTYRH
jgi:hypothetical protein